MKNQSSKFRLLNQSEFDQITETETAGFYSNLSQARRLKRQYDRKMKQLLSKSPLAELGSQSPETTKMMPSMASPKASRLQRGETSLHGGSLNDSYLTKLMSK